MSRPLPVRPPRRTLRSVQQLVDAGLVPAERSAELRAVTARYDVALTEEVIAQLDPADPADPIARQYLPTSAELELDPQELGDPIGDARHTPLPGITHRYPDRLLLKPLHTCAVYCRYCFRRERVGRGGELLDPEQLEAALAYVAAHPEVWEVILSGGDPLLLSDRRLKALLARLAAIPQVETLRIHTRVPLVDPARIQGPLLASLRQSVPVYLVLHCNHPRELSAPVRAACARLVDAGIPLLSQSVLLRGVNADATVLEQLFRGLVRARVKPYYLHHPDPAPGTSQFRVSIAAGQALMRRLRGRVSGLCLPTYVLDIPGGHGKVPIGPTYLSEPGPAGTRTVMDYQGRRHRYPERGGSA